MKKMFSLALALIMALALCVPTMAADIIVTGAVENQTYNAYKIFDLTKTGDGEDAGYAYTIEGNSEWFNVIVEDYMEKEIVAGAKSYTGNGLTFEKSTVGNTWNVSVDSSFDDAAAATLAEDLNAAKAGKSIKATATGVASGETVLNIGNDIGYYFVDSSVGSLCALLTENASQPLVEKNDVPELGKTVASDDVSAAIGDVINYTLTLTAGGKADTTYIIHDTMSDSLTLDADSFEIKIGETAVDGANYTIITDAAALEADGCTFEIVFAQAYTATLARDTVITITYSAVLNEKAIDENVAENTANLQYGNTYTPNQKTQTYSYDFDLFKYTNGEAGKVKLDGAKFTLSKSADGTNPIAFIKEADGGYRVALTGETGTTTTLDAGEVNIDGLDVGTYYLTEIQAPAGYNKLAEPVEVVIEADAQTAGGHIIKGRDANNELVSVAKVEVLNQTGNELPATGGMGTTIFYTVGGLLMAAAVILLITKKKMAVQE